MGLAVRVIPCLDVHAGRVVKGLRFVDIRDAGDPVECARRYEGEGADELCLLDITATQEGRDATYEVVGQVATQLTIPLTVGGGVGSVEDFDRLLRCGADKVSVNSKALADPQLIERLAERFGSQCVVLAVDAKKAQNGWEAYTHGGRQGTGVDVVTWCRQAVELGAGEILLTSMDADGTLDGYDLSQIAAVCDSVTVPVIASGGAGKLGHFAEAVRAGADAVLAASVFHDGVYEVKMAKDGLAAAGCEVRY